MLVFYKTLCQCQKLKSGLHYCWNYEYGALTLLAYKGQRNQIIHIKSKKCKFDQDIGKFQGSLNLSTAWKDDSLNTATQNSQLIPVNAKVLWLWFNSFINHESLLVYPPLVSIYTHVTLSQFLLLIPNGPNLFTCTYTLIWICHMSLQDYEAIKAESIFGLLVYNTSLKLEYCFY